MVDVHVSQAARAEKLERIIRNTMWMACRYVHGRQSYAVGMYNEAARLANELGVLSGRPASGEPIFAIDGDMTAAMSGLSPEEFETAYAAWAGEEQIFNHCQPRFRNLKDQTNG